MPSPSSRCPPSIWKRDGAASPGGTATTTTCGQHPGEVPHQYCDTCAATICRKCAHEHAADHTLLTIEAAALKLLAEATRGVERVRERLRQSSEAADVVGRAFDQAAAEFRECSRRLFAAVEARERKLLSRVEEERRARSAFLTHHAEALSAMLQRYLRLEKDLHASANAGKCVEAHDARSTAMAELVKLRAVHGDLEKAVAEAELVVEGALFEEGSVVGFESAVAVLRSALSSADDAIRSARGLPARPAGREYESIRRPAVVFGGEGDEDGQFLRPWGICCDLDGRLIVADRSNSRIQVFHRDGTFLFKFGSQGIGPGQFDRPTGVATDAAGRIIVVDKDNHRIQVFSPDGSFLFLFGKLGSENGQFNYPWDVAVNGKGQMCVSDTKNHRVQLFTAEGEFLQKFGWEDSKMMWSHFDFPRSVCFTANGYLIVTDFNKHRLVVVEPSFTNARYLGSEGTGIKEFERPQGITVDSNGNIIVADSKNNRIQIFAPNGDFRCQIAEVDIDRPSGICVTPHGMIAVVDFGNNQVVIF